MVDINFTLLIQIINFLFLIWALNKFLYKPIRQVLSQRKQTISGLEEGISQAEEGMLQKDAALKAGLKEAREKGIKEKEAFEKEARQEEMKLIEKINEKARADLAEVQERILKETQSARNSLQKEIDGFADAISRKIVGRAV
jgi:F-type H+-transporting ATPase subunit b